MTDYLVSDSSSMASQAMSGGQTDAKLILCRSAVSAPVLCLCVANMFCSWKPGKEENQKLLKSR